MMDVKGKCYMVIGMARSGLAAARLLADHGARGILNDSKPIDAFGSELEALQGDQFVPALGRDPVDFLTAVDGIVVSPGVPTHLPVFAAAAEKQVPVLAEIELGYQYAKAPIIAIGGTNGKTTTTALTGEIFAATGQTTFVLGNIGLPLTAEVARAAEKDVIVAEIASLQLENTSAFRPRAAVLLNITEDHLDRFGTMERYIAAKAKMFAQQTPADIAVLNADDPLSQKLRPHIRARLLTFSRQHEVEEGAFIQQGHIVFRLDGKDTKVAPLSDLRIPGPHNVENALAAVALALSQGVPVECVAQAVASFAGVEHRIEFVQEKEGIHYINDSKATNPDSAIKAVQAMERPTVLMLGGSNKNSDYCPLFEAFEGRIKAVVALGETRRQILRDAQIAGYTSIHVCEGDFAQAFAMGRGLAAEGDTVLLSPACASYDMFHNFEERGAYFKELVGRL